MTRVRCGAANCGYEHDAGTTCVMDTPHWSARFMVEWRGDGVMITPTRWPYSWLFARYTPLRALAVVWLIYADRRDLRRDAAR